MLSYCNHCRVTIRGSDDVCPLCHNPIPEVDCEGMDLATVITEEVLCEDVFPYVEVVDERHIAIRILSIISIASIVISYLIYWLVGSAINWPLFVVIGAGSMWLSIWTILRKRYNIGKTIIWHLILLSLVGLLIDWLTGWHYWSIEYLIPILCFAALITMAVLVRITKLGKGNFTIYMITGALLGLIPLVFIFFNWVQMIIPAAICVATSVIFLAAVLIFNGRLFVHESKKRFHI
ncbi:MAG: DUF6320 domain-containing protein [Fastidiosipilaceae bacterium]|jgi:hypothetical protein|nr:hypothetical protein [Clostridiaceae bacterium]